MSRIGSFSIAYRVLYAYGKRSSPLHAIVDVVIVARGRTEIGMIGTFPLASASVTWAAEQRLAGTLLERAT